MKAIDTEKAKYLIFITQTKRTKEIHFKRLNLKLTSLILSKWLLLHYAKFVDFWNWNFT